ncbi:MAG TPA: hypothetical protein VKT51_06315 [Candidatus Eremiobacteraceae bacterium]|nr:hypothetical protein [Candidatus Eremiobacteraceae bacterium]
MTRFVVAVMLCGCVLCTLGGCSRNSSETTSASATVTPEATDTSGAVVGADSMAAPSSSPTPPWGKIDFSPDLVVAFTPVCAAAPAGAGPDSGYTLTFGVNDQVSYGKLRIPDYAGADGTFSESDKVLAQDPALAIVFKTDSLRITKDSTIDTSLTEHGLHGVAQLGNFSLDGNAKNAGSITWECTELQQ